MDPVREDSGLLAAQVREERMRREVRCCLFRLASALDEDGRLEHEVRQLVDWLERGRRV